MWNVKFVLCSNLPCFDGCEKDLALKYLLSQLRCASTAAHIPLSYGIRKGQASRQLRYGVSLHFGWVTEESKITDDKPCSVLVGISFWTHSDRKELLDLHQPLPGGMLEGRIVSVGWILLGSKLGDDVV